MNQMCKLEYTIFFLTFFFLEYIFLQYSMCADYKRTEFSRLEFNKKSPLVIPVDTGRKLNVHKTFRRRPGRLLNVLCTSNLRPVSMGMMHKLISRIYQTFGDKNGIFTPRIYCFCQRCNKALIPCEPRYCKIL